MPTGTRSNISANSATKPRIQTASVLKCGIVSLDRLDLVLATEQLRMEDQPVGAHDEQKHRGREYVDDPFGAIAHIGIEQVDSDVIAAIRRRRDAPENENAEQKPAEIVAVGNLHAEKLAQHHRDEDVERHDADEEGGNQLDAVDENVHRIARRHILRLGDSGNGSFGFRHETRSKLLTLPCQGEGAAK